MWRNRIFLTVGFIKFLRYSGEQLEKIPFVFMSFISCVSPGAIFYSNWSANWSSNVTAMCPCPRLFRTGKEGVFHNYAHSRYQVLNSLNQTLLVFVPGTTILYSIFISICRKLSHCFYAHLVVFGSLGYLDHLVAPLTPFLLDYSS